MSKCVGCGVLLQNIDKNKDGYVSSLEHKICERCFVIKNYGQNKVISKTNVDYMEILDKINEDDLVVYVSSLLTLNVILVLTKRDVLPKSVKDNKIVKYINERYFNILDTVIVSAYKKVNLDTLYNKLNSYGNGKNIYFVGITNSGKSTLINEMIKSYNGYSGEITMSNYPSTTLGVVDVKIGNLMIKDTPGIVIDNSLVNYMDMTGIKKINSKKEIKPITFQLKNIGGILVEDILRIEYSCEETSMTFYMSNNVDISSISLQNPRMSDCQYIEYDLKDKQDIVIEDLGFIKVTHGCKVKLFYKNNLYVYTRDNLI